MPGLGARPSWIPLRDPLHRHSGGRRNPASVLRAACRIPSSFRRTPESSFCFASPSWTPTFVGVTNKNCRIPSSFRRTPESSFCFAHSGWTPTFVGVTEEKMELNSSAVIGEGGAIAGGLGAEKFDRTRQHLRRDESVIAKNHTGGRSAMKERKPEPKLNQMVLVETWSADDTLRGPQGFGDVIVYRIPIGLFFAPIDLVEKQAGYLALVDVAKPRPGEAHLQTTTGALEQADERQKVLEIRRADIIARGHAAAGSNGCPIIIELPLLGNDQLGPKGHVGSFCRHRRSSPNRSRAFVPRVYELSALAAQEWRADFLKARFTCNGRETDLTTFSDGQGLFSSPVSTVRQRSWAPPSGIPEASPISRDIVQVRDYNACASAA